MSDDDYIYEDEGQCEPEPEPEPEPEQEEQEQELPFFRKIDEKTLNYYTLKELLKVFDNHEHVNNILEAQFMFYYDNIISKEKLIDFILLTPDLSEKQLNYYLIKASQDKKIKQDIQDKQGKQGKQGYGGLQNETIVIRKIDPYYEDLLNYLILVFKFIKEHEDYDRQLVLTYLGPFIVSKLSNDDIDDIYQHKLIYENIISIIDICRDLLNFKNEKSNKIGSLLSYYKDLDLSVKITSLLNIYKDLKDDKDDKDKLDNKQFRIINYNRHSFMSEKTVIQNRNILNKYIRPLQRDLPKDIYISVNEKNFSLMTFLIIGQKDTPYENGCFLFDLMLPENFPNEPPKVKFLTTDNGRVRFNPNLYNCGKVCLSLLGTWTGPSWSSEYSTILQILISIQAFIFVENPYSNEPSYYNTSKNDSRAIAYNNNIRTETLKVAINNRHKIKDTEEFLFSDIIEKHKLDNKL